jgi:hypothetical protein
MGQSFRPFVENIVEGGEQFNWILLHEFARFFVSSGGRHFGVDWWEQTHIAVRFPRTRHLARPSVLCDVVGVVAEFMVSVAVWR